MWILHSTTTLPPKHESPIFNTHLTNHYSSCCRIQYLHCTSHIGIPFRPFPYSITPNNCRTRIILTKVHSSIMPHSNRWIPYNYQYDATRVQYHIMLTTSPIFSRYQFHLSQRLPHINFTNKSSHEYYDPLYPPTYSQLPIRYLTSTKVTRYK